MGSFDAYGAVREFDQAFSIVETVWRNLNLVMGPRQVTLAVVARALGADLHNKRSPF